MRSIRHNIETPTLVPRLNPGDEVVRGTVHSHEAMGGAAICIRCRGRGWIPEGLAEARCPQCNGSGEITASAGDA